MNPKKEFISAIMSVLRLENNIYVTASIEEIVDRVDVPDYTMFIAYLGERDSDFEKPIQSIAKAVDEFHNEKTEPLILATSNKISEQISLLAGFHEYLIEKILGYKKEEAYHKTIEENKNREKDNQLYYIDVIDAAEKKATETILKMDDTRLSEIKQTTTSANGVKIINFDQEILEKWEISLHDIFHKNLNLSTVRVLDIVRSKLLKPSIIDKIKHNAIEEATKTIKIESSRVTQLIGEFQSKKVMMF